MKNYFNELLSMSNDLNLDEFYSVSTEKVKQNTSSRISYLKLKYSAASHRTNNFQSTQQQHKITSEKLKILCKLCSNTFGKQKSTAIKKVECA